MAEQERRDQGAVAIQLDHSFCRVRLLSGGGKAEQQIKVGWLFDGKEMVVGPQDGGG